MLQRKRVDDEPCMYFDDEAWYDVDRAEVRRSRGGLWQRGGYESYMTDDEWETLEGGESKRLEAEYQRLVMAGEIEDIDLLTERPRWIPVGERLPEDRQQCFVARCDSVGIAWWHDDFRLFVHDDIGNHWTPSHWMPRPAPPEVTP